MASLRANPEATDQSKTVVPNCNEVQIILCWQRYQQLLVHGKLQEAEIKELMVQGRVHFSSQKLQDGEAKWAYQTAALQSGQIWPTWPPYCGVDRVLQEPEGRNKRKAASSPREKKE